MKIYFEDGQLRNLSQLPIKPDFILDASEGVNANINFLVSIGKRNPEAIIYTNSIFAFDNRYAWNEKLEVPEVYIRAGEYMLFTRIDALTDRLLREGHNLSKMYISGEFEDI